MADMKKVYDDLIIINLLEEIETNKTDLAFNFNYRAKIFLKIWLRPVYLEDKSKQMEFGTQSVNET